MRGNRKNQSKEFKAKKFKPGHSGNPGGRATGGRLLAKHIKKINPHEMAELANLLLIKSYEEIEKISKDKKGQGLKVITAAALVGSYQRKEFSTANLVLSRLMTGAPPVTPMPNTGGGPLVSFEEYARHAHYPIPYPKQVEMMNFIFRDDGKPRMLLGARDYGKTDYGTVLGSSFKLYRKPDYRILIVTKSKLRNRGLLYAIAAACKAHGMTFEIENAYDLRLPGVVGKEHTVTALPLGTSDFRGRHPDLIICDDLVTPEDSSPATRARVTVVYEELVKICENLVIIGQPVHKHDLYQTLRPKLELMEVPHGSIPELDADLEAMKLAGMSQATIDASYHLKISDLTVTGFENIKSLAKYPTPADSIAFMDPSNRGKDYTAISIATGLFDGIAVIGFCWRKAWDLCMPDVKEKLQLYGVKRLAFETNNLGENALNQVRVHLKDTGIGVTGADSTTNKHATIMAAAGYAEIIHLAETSDTEYKKQVREYEYNAPFDDSPDSLARLLEWSGFLKGK